MYYIAELSTEVRMLTSLVTVPAFPVSQNHFVLAREDCLMALVVSAGLYEPVSSITNKTNLQNKLLLC